MHVECWNTGISYIVFTANQKPCFPFMFASLWATHSRAAKLKIRCRGLPLFLKSLFHSGKCVRSAAVKYRAHNLSKSKFNKAVRLRSILVAAKVFLSSFFVVSRTERRAIFFPAPAPNRISSRFGKQEIRSPVFFVLQTGPLQT